VENSTLIKMKQFYRRKPRWHGYYPKIQRLIPDEIKHDLYSSKEFLEWFKGFDFESAWKNRPVYRDLHNKIPYPLAKMLSKFYKLMDIKIR